jgi:2,5-diamino-6-(ribosylamino)-4(3H)-pyrimidinone 5'-phosphate reductase
MAKTSSRPHVSINVAVSADGKISTYRREKFSLGSKEDRHLMDVLRARADAVIVGSRTVALDGWAIRVRNADIRRKRVAKGRSPHPLNVVLTTRLDLPSKCQFFEHPRTEKLIVTTSLAPASRIRRFEKLAEVAVLPSKAIRPAKALEELRKRGCRNVLLEGGGELDFSFFKENLVDELYITITPRILGGRQAPTPADGAGFLKDKQLRLELVSCRRRGDEVFLKYSVKS